MILVLEAHREAEEVRLDRERILNYELARLIAYAVHKPSKMPEFKTTMKAVNIDRAPTEADHERLRAHFIRLAVRSQKAEMRKAHGK